MLHAWTTGIRRPAGTKVLVSTSMFKIEMKYAIISYDGINAVGA
jgi:hypothetical protein